MKQVLVGLLYLLVIVGCCWLGAWTFYIFENNNSDTVELVPSDTVIMYDEPEPINCSPDLKRRRWSNER